MTSDDAVELELAADQAELVLRRDTYLAALRHLSPEAGRAGCGNRPALPGPAGWGRCRAGCRRYPAAAAIVGAYARLIVAVQFSEYGSRRLHELGLTLGDA